MWRLPYFPFNEMTNSLTVPLQAYIWTDLDFVQFSLSALFHIICITSHDKLLITMSSFKTHVSMEDLDSY